MSPEFLLVGCQYSSNDALIEANKYLKSKGLYNDKKVVVADGGGVWIVNYRPPNGYIGGDDEVIVDKKLRKVVKYVGSQ